jgi:hypothetical protein
MAPTFGRKNPRPVYKARAVVPTVPSKPKPSFTSNSTLYACMGGAVALLILGAIVLNS